jgi:predicted DNA-binding protein
MSTDSTARTIQVSPELLAAVKDAAWKEHTTASDVIRTAIEKVNLDSSQVAGWGDDPGSGSKRLAFIISDEQWEQLKAAAWLNRTSVAAVVRIAVQHYIEA